jgi:hypothetical protein
LFQKNYAASEARVHHGMRKPPSHCGTAATISWSLPLDFLHDETARRVDQEYAVINDGVAIRTYRGELQA